MKKAIVIIAAIGAIVLANAAQAQIITSVQFTNSSGTSLTPSELAGFDAASDWNIGTLTGTPGTNSGTAKINTGSSLITSTGGASGLSYSITSYGNKNATETFTNTDPDNVADGVLLSNGAASRGAGSSGASAPNPVSLTLNGLNPNDSYEFIVYVGTQGSLTGEYSLSLNGSSLQYAITSYGGNYNSTQHSFVDGASTTDFELAANGGPVTTTAGNYDANYLEYNSVTGLSSATLSLTVLGDYPSTFVAAGSPSYIANGGVTVDISGIQVINLGSDAVPEPSTWALMAAGMLGLIFIQSRRARRN